MDVIFDIQSGKCFSIEVGFFDTILEIKEKIHKYRAIPVSRQTLIMNGHVLEDERDIQFYEILQNSHIQLHIPPDSSENYSLIKTGRPSSRKIQLKLNLPSSKTFVPLEMDANASVLRLKEKIQEITEPAAISRIVVKSSGAELRDHRSLSDCELADNAELDINIGSPSPTGSVGTPAGSKKLRLMVLPKCGINKIPVEMNASDNVGELRKELQKLQERFHFHLPQEGYFFIYKQNVMEDDRSFRWHHVGQGDTIEIFNGSVSGGS